MRSPFSRAIAVWLLASLAVRASVATYLPAGFDEAYYYAYALHPQWSYFDHPLLVGLSTSFGTWLTGFVSPLTIRIGSLLLYTGSQIFLGLTARRLFGDKAGVWAIALSTTIPIFAIGFGTLTLPDAPLIFFWSACTYVAACEFFPHFGGTYRPTARLTLVSLLVGLACLGKYHGFVLGFGLVCFCILSPPHRRVWTSMWTVLGFFAFAIALLPILVWNANHDWASFVFQSSRAVPAEGYQLGRLALTWLATIAILWPPFGFPLWWETLSSSARQLASPFTHPPRGRDIRLKYRFILCISLPVALGFTLIGGYRPILPTWPAPGLWELTVLLAAAAARWSDRAPSWISRWFVTSGASLGVLIAIALLHLNLGILQTPSQNAWFGGFIPVAVDGSTQLLDIAQLRRKVRQSPQILEAIASSDFYLSNHWFLSGQTAMTLIPIERKPVTCFSSDDPRGFAYWSRPSDWLGQTGLYVTTSTYRRSLDNTDSVATFREYFDDVEPVGAIELERGGEAIATVEFFQATSLQKPFPNPYGMSNDVKNRGEGHLQNSRLKAGESRVP
ncbi:MAG: glycosyltransferase family 39 protein [Cyanobacteria bacterium J06639_1]